MEQASLRLMQALQQRGHQLSLISLHRLGSLAPQLQASAIPSLGLDYGQVPSWRWMARLRRELQLQKPDALLLTGHSLPVLFCIAGICRGRRVLSINFHHSGVKPRFFWRLYYAIARPMVNAVAFPSDFVREEAVNILPTLSRKAYTIRYPMQAPPVVACSERDSARRLLGLPAHAPVLGNAGWLIKRKRFDVFLHVAAEVIKSNPDARFLIAGDGPERSRLEALAHDLGISHAVVWSGWVKDMRTVYAALDVLIFNSDWDAMGLTPLEAVIHGVPVVCSVLNGGLSEVLRAGVDATLLDHHDIHALSQAALWLLDHPTDAVEMTTRARERLLALSDPDQQAAWFEQAFTLH